jgi:hypothetical protein
MSQQSSIDLDYRPSTYWPESENQEQRLSHIHGKGRRDITRNALESGGIRELNWIGPELSAESLSEQDRQAWGRIHPSMMGGEYLPQYEENEVEIARISLKSVTSDQISIRASGRDRDIHYSVVDEYETGYQLAIERSQEPLTLAELITLLDQTDNPFKEAGGGLVRSHWKFNIEYMDPEEAIDFVSVESAFYLDLRSYYSEEAEEWLAEQSTNDEEFSYV